ncbi:tyrosine-type recombinase/integrase [Wenyingzhuangia aestuarii]|uniref:tyrosine-type recombinase/integrase n=1 Tax=Wenyingzhuangia aestuarii TaxID=1647582 RepID=UPI00143ADB0C|nr:tyrosine-type recombinase/integrase [Wenyingzhuangia aestuarii]NJB83122.1 integrase [Wenyingzhuangia aestuarii]
MQLSFSLRKDKKNKNGLMPIQLNITFNNQKIRQTVKEVRVLEKDWKKERIKPNLKSEKYNFHTEYNKILEDLETKVNTIFRFIHLNEILPTKDIILKKLQDHDFGKEKLVYNFFDKYEEFIESRTHTHAKGTITKYKSCGKFFRDFSERKNYVLRFDTIDIQFFEAFGKYCFTEKQTLNNYFAKLIKVLKTFMNWSLEREYHDNLSFKKFKAPEDDIDVIYLTTEELMILYNYKFNDIELDKARDFYCMGAFTGLRISDLNNLSNANISENEITLTNIKTKTTNRTIPLNKYSSEIIEKYKDSIHFPIPKITKNKVNRDIKKACRIAKINKEINTTRYIGSTVVNRTNKKHELITIHTARKTFITNSLFLGMKEHIVKEISNHSDDKSFKKYVHVSNIQKKSAMTNTWDKI